jgi:ribosomal protein RSM22 (predicted rRNA methylase)
MHLPFDLIQAIEEEINTLDLKSLANASRELSARYRNRDSQQQAFHIPKFMETPEHRAAYIVSRLPATYAAVLRVFSEVKERQPDREPKSLLDLGSGPGTALWAANQIFLQLEQITLLEQDENLISLSQRLLKNVITPHEQHRHWQKADLSQPSTFKPHDIVVISYAIGELNEHIIEPLIKAAWEASLQHCVIIEPGTQLGFEKIRLVRDLLIKSGAFILAPCSHANACPMQNGNWCHFPQRLERSFLQRYVKEATLGFEDEKFSYLIASKYPGESFEGRILRHPKKHSGHVELELCTAEGLKKETISRKQGDRYKKSRHASWGDMLSSRPMPIDHLKDSND